MQISLNSLYLDQISFTSHKNRKKPSKRPRIEYEDRYERRNYSNYLNDEEELEIPRRAERPRFVKKNNFAPTIYLGPTKTSGISQTEDVGGGYKFKIKKLPNLPCPSCGKTMITHEESENIIRMTAGSKGRSLQMHLAQILPKVNSTEERIITELIEASKKSPDKHLEVIFREIGPKHEQRFLDKGLKVLNKAMNIYPAQIDEFTRSVRAQLFKGKSIIEKEKEGINEKEFSKNLVLNNIRHTDKTNVNPENLRYYNKVIQTLENEIPKEEDHEGAFYREHKKDSAAGIVRALLHSATISAEHLIPKSKGGDENKSNLIAECYKCNIKRDNTPYLRFVEDNPIVIRNHQVYIDAVIDRINNGEITGFEDYPRLVKRRLAELTIPEYDSEPLINLDISRLDLNA